ncbi:MAG: cyclic beta 1-2 glucan synthetase [Cyclobacteriaceae bacterium]|nr:cyclic beta 1-2 glucan synthetase [Cyclobacteriaceae bacterium]
MKGTTVTLEELLSPLKQYFEKDTFVRSDINNAPPLRAELFTIEQFGTHATELALRHEINEKKAPEHLLKRLADNEEVILRVIDLLQEAIQFKTPISPAGEWLLDNFYLIDEQIKIGKKHLPKGYSKGLPKLVNTGLPRVYDIAIEIISHSDGHLDIHILNRFIQSYQKTSELTLGELWAIPIMLRLALLENLRRVASRVAIDRIDANSAHHWADCIIETAENNPKNLVLTMADMARSNPPMVSAFIAEYSRKLQWKGINLTLPLSWVEQHLVETGDTISGMVLSENQKQAADHVSMSNSIKSLRFLAKTNWQDFVEEMSLVEKTLKTDQNGVYPKMDFYTRDLYRHSIEKISKKTRLSENEVAKSVIKLAHQHSETSNADDYKSHVGYYLIGDGLKTTEKTLKARVSFTEFFKELFKNNKSTFYVLGAILLTIGVGGGLILKAYTEQGRNAFFYVMSVLSLLGASQLAISIVNWIATMRTNPKPLPKMDFSKGLPKDSRTLVIIPTMITGGKQIEKLVEELEIRFLGNRDPHLLFGLLTDFRDADKETMPEDAELLAMAKDCISALNKKYSNKSEDFFFLFHRPRRWNGVDKKWMGYERKRGKLGELNQLLRGHGKDRFAEIVGNEESYKSVKYIITLDTDTQLPRESAAKLVGIMAHPLNRPIYDEVKKRVVKGYGIIQPRIAVSVHGAVLSRYTRLHENDSGIDPYTRVTSDVYQDIFNEGSFIGKGIYEVDTFERVLNNRFPENRILSHDLLEGSYVRSGFASDVQFYEETPPRYSMDISRRHRWIRGDWQIGTWFLPWVPNAQRKLTSNPISALSRWKILDNLRRSLVPIALLTMLVLGWTLSSFPLFWTVTVLGILIIPTLTMSGWHLTQKPKEVTFSSHAENVFDNTSKGLLLSLFEVICLPYEAFISADAIGRTLIRMFITRKNMLEWNPSGFLQKQKENLFTLTLKMFFAPLLSAALIYLLINYYAFSFYLAIPFLVLWILSPAVAYWVSIPIKAYKTTVTHDQKMYLRGLARKTWAYFEAHVTASENWLPPDNLQQYPIVKIAHRTSPTNIGLALLSNLTAYDFGYIGGMQLINRTYNTFLTLKKLDRYAGHFYNWYDTQSLATLQPRYISTVDSGNLAGHLIVLRQGLLDLPNRPIVNNNLWKGLYDTVQVLFQHVAPSNEKAFSILQKGFAELNFSETLSLKQVKAGLEKISGSVNRFILDEEFKKSEDVMEWVRSLQHQLSAWQSELALLNPLLQYEERPERFKNIKLTTDSTSLNDLILLEENLSEKLKEFQNVKLSDLEAAWLFNFEKSVHEASSTAKEKIAEIKRLAEDCQDFSNMEYDFLYDRDQHLVSIGYSVDDHRLDASFYDLLASEARLGLFVAIAQGKIPQESWFALGRRLAETNSSPVLLSWSGSMFEYLMPNLVMPVYENTLLDETSKGCVRKQIEYGKQQGVPWGISESCYNVVDANLTYQYRAFGVPDLGFKRGLGLDLVIAPYATVMSLMIDPAAACKNLKRLESKGYSGKYGLFESIDYTPLRLTRSKVPALIQSFMVHHQGMSLLALDHLLYDQPMQKRFEADTVLQTALLLLQERVPKSISFYSLPKDSEEIVHTASAGEIRVLNTPDGSHPEIQLLSNGKYHVMVSNSGGGYSRYNEMAITRWREDSTRDNWGTFSYIRDLEDGEFWSNTYQPTLKKGLSYEAIFSQGRVEFRRIDKGIELHTEIIVSPEDNVEIRRIHITNHTRSERKLEITSYGEVVMALPVADDAHPAFNNLFVQTEILSSQHAILCTRRPRSDEETPPWVFHLMKVTHAKTDHISYETDRYKFIGRGNSIANPQAMIQEEPLSNTEGPVLDPITSVQYRITLGAEATAIIDIITGISESRSGCQNLVDKYQDRNFRNRAFELTWTHSQVVLRQINATESDSQLFSRLASSILYANPSLRAPKDVLIKNSRGQSALWSHSISGDLPIVLLQVSDSTNITLIKQLMQARAYWLFKGLVIDLVIINEDHSGYRQVLQEQVQSLISAGIGINPSVKQGNIIVRLSDQISTEDRVLLQTVARVIISDKNGTLLDHLDRRQKSGPVIPLLTQTKRNEPGDETPLAISERLFDNGMGGFSTDGTEYVITTDADNPTPLPWSNVIANPNFGTIVTESGPVYTWAENAHEFRLTPWNNDPVSNNGGEVFYMRDEESGKVWSPMPFPAPSTSNFVTRHGFGYSVFETREDGISTEVWIYVDREAQIKFTVIKIKNLSGRARSLSATGYAEWVLGGLRPGSVMHVVTEPDAETGTLLTRNPYNTEFPNRVVFFDANSAKYSFTTDRHEFIGRNGTLEDPDGMKRQRLSGNYGAGLDPCSAIQIPFVLSSGQDKEIIFRMGTGKDIHEVRNMLSKFKGRDAAVNSLSVIREYWRTTLGHVKVKTPDPALNILANGWLMYQVISCRLWGRSGFYQSGGAFGFRDQLQDVLALMDAAPQLTRDQILLSASRQFREGDVQHWWHPPLGRGVRTRCSDDMLWIAFTTSRYVTHTHDFAILKELVSFIEGRELNADQESSYDLPVSSDEKTTLYDHCKRAITHSLKFGSHGLPFMGSGDWNDGMNNVGIKGQGESVWLAFFLFDVLRRFEPIAIVMQDEAFVKTCREAAADLKVSIDKAWDGEWYRRAYFDDGTPLGSSQNTECRIDSISQSWAVLSEAGTPERVHQAMESVDKYLVDKTNSLIRLLDPPFNHSEKDPGYIKGYLPGVRENGGQYSHAAIWMVMAVAKMGNRQRTWDLLQIINPINHGRSKDDIKVYKTEPYVMAADVYGVEPHVGRGGWTWYTGSAGWMYQLVMESFLGLRREGSKLFINPCVPESWKSFDVEYRYMNTLYKIEIILSSEKDISIKVDGTTQKENAIQLVDDGKEHKVVAKVSAVKLNAVMVEETAPSVH